MHEPLKNSTLTRSLADVIGDLSDLFQKEMKLARAEISAKLATKLKGGAWIAAAGALGIFATLLLLEGMVFAVASFGIEMHWSCLMVSAVTGALAAGAYLIGRSGINEEVTPNRTLNQIKQDIAVTKERLT
jgi:hypothetical protein